MDCRLTCTYFAELVVSHLPCCVQLQFVSQEGGPLRYGEPGGAGPLQRAQQRPHLPGEVWRQAANDNLCSFYFTELIGFSFVLQPSNGVAVKVHIEEKLLVLPYMDLALYFKISSLFHPNPHWYDDFMLCDSEQIFRFTHFHHYFHENALILL